MIKRPEETNPQDVVDALFRYVSESAESQREVAKKIGISYATLADWFANQAQPHKRRLAQVAGFLRRVGYL
ncbi:MAG TPA: helix-turn-helix transcriptional regulator [Chthoniobacterales bacterium]|nr:helix-turn-helix transcriptional regulator [Chthoniobacterales bacterium]